MVLQAFAVSLLSTAAAEFGDKTQLGLIMLAASLRNTRAILSGMIAGFAVVAGLGVLVGQALLTIIPLSTLTMISGVIFVTVGLLMLKVDVKTNAPLNTFREHFPSRVIDDSLDRTGRQNTDHNNRPRSTFRAAHGGILSCIARIRDGT
jgi:uncharacterized membrane protein